MFLKRPNWPINVKMASNTRLCNICHVYGVPWWHFWKSFAVDISHYLTQSTRYRESSMGCLLDIMLRPRVVEFLCFTRLRRMKIGKFKNEWSQPYRYWHLILHFLSPMPKWAISTSIMFKMHTSSTKSNATCLIRHHVASHVTFSVPSIMSQ